MLQRIISILFFVPLFLFLALMLINKNVLFQQANISIFWFYTFENIPIVLALTFFFSIYIIIIWLLMKFSNIFTDMKTTKLSHEVTTLKAELHDKQGDLIKTVTEEFFDVLKGFKSESEKSLSQVMYELKGIKEKMEKWEKE